MKKRGLKILLADAALCAAVVLAALGGYGKITRPAAAGQEIAGQEQADREIKKQVALTFDDGPDGEYTPILLDGLKKRHVRATFFLLGKQIDQYPDLVKRMHAEGHIVGCHSYEHVNFRKLPEEKACEQIRKTNERIAALTGEYPAYVRPPYGAWLPALDKDFCMAEVLWDVDPLDWASKNADTVVQRVLADVEEYDIILLHDASRSSVDAALRLIDVMQEDGYEFVTVEDLLFP